uniref:Uncharacterized protein n=1 Tax=Odontella aurita TaxID=265563 RepID=A0A7S4I3H5_9STRA|mmetsp:Transcript_1934/g.5116  ORF Transcript_1934/g.5116 Transcript_1934/m.5116 type:complete len:479 (+) Transcript_1934:221-1657(+)
MTCRTKRPSPVAETNGSADGNHKRAEVLFPAVAAGGKYCFNVDGLPHDVLGDILAFVGPDYYRYIAGTCQALRRSYCQMLTANARERGGFNNDIARTSMKNMASSRSCIMLFLKEVGDIFLALRSVVFHADFEVFRWLDTSIRVKSPTGEYMQPNSYSKILSTVEGFAALAGRIRILEYLRNEHKLQYSVRTCNAAAQGGRTDVLSHLRDQGVKPTSSVCGYAARNGHIHVLEYLRDDCGVEFDIHTFAAAVTVGKFPVVEYLHENGCPRDARLSYFAARSGHLDVLIFLFDNNYPFNETTCMGAAQGGHVKCMQFLHAVLCPIDIEASYQAAMNGHVPMLKYLRESGAPFHPRVIDEAAASGHVNVLDYMYGIGFSVSVDECNVAAEAGHLEVLKFLHERDCPWDTEACEMAATNGHLHCLEFLHTKCCPWDFQAMRGADLCRHLKVLWYLRVNCCPLDPIQDTKTLDFSPLFSNAS